MKGPIRRTCMQYQRRRFRYNAFYYMNDSTGTQLPMHQCSIVKETTLHPFYTFIIKGVKFKITPIITQSHIICYILF